ncbi:MAG TPA: hypothetical protein VJR89_06100, partial [Polyangiales bacterium]|nr:hypothetical protein [Polyangiales bacterium]
VVDQSAYAARMGDDPQLRARVTERSRSWREFAAARGQTACIVDLARLRAGEHPDDAVQKGVREALARAASA